MPGPHFLLFMQFAIVLISSSSSMYGVQLNPRTIRIGMVAPYAEAIPPKKYGGTERVVYYLTEELVKRGYNVTLFASSDSVTSATLFTHPNWVSNENRNWSDPDALPEWISREWMIEQVKRHADQFDILHFHTDEHFVIIRHIDVGRTVTTLHKPSSLTGFEDLIKLFPEVPLVSISNDQRRHTNFQPNYVATVYTGIPTYPFTYKPRGDPIDGQPYLAFLGRISKLKGPDVAIQVAVKAGIRLIMAAKVEDVDYWNKTIRPMIEQHKGKVKVIGQISDMDKGNFLGNALALIFPITWDEPFGLVMVEAMATGTPIIAKPMGSVPEIIKEGITGFTFKTIEEGVKAVRRAAQLDRKAVRNEFMGRFTIDKMVDGYESVYNQILEKNADSIK